MTIKKTLFFLAAGAFLVLGSSAMADDDCSDPVETGQGVFVGYADERYDACVYRGIPYAKPPVGDLRLKRPQPPDPHAGALEAFEFGPVCEQGSDQYSEDCLYLNIYRPKKSGVFPVMFWIHGGGFISGSGSFVFYDGARLASRDDVVVVTINYRLGPLGFLALPELKEEDPKGGTGNYGTLDQVRALEWTRDNVAAFGGDPGNVTAFGQSAGGMSICTLLAAPEAEGLFHRAMIMSAPCRLFTELGKGYEKTRSALKKIGCDGEGDVLECLRAKPAKAFNLKGGNDMFTGGTPWSPTVDGSYLTDMPLNLIERGEYHKMPTIISTTHDELRLYTMSIPGLGAWPRSSVNLLLKGLVGPNYKEIRALYDYREFRRPIDLALAFGNQMTFDAPLYMMAEAMSGQNPVYVYRFDWHETRYPHKMGAFHAIDVPFVFGAFTMDFEIARMVASKKIFEENEYLSLHVMDYVTSFARNGVPAADGAPEWPAYATESKYRLYIDKEITALPLTEKEVERYEWYADRTMGDIMEGPISRFTFTNEDRNE